MNDFYIDMEKNPENTSTVVGASNCVICERPILLGTWYAMKDTVLCKECKTRLKKQLYGIRELEDNE